MIGSEDEDQDEVVLIRDPKREEIDTEAQSDFDREFAKMLADTTDARRGDRKNAAPIFDSAVPHIKRKPDELQPPGSLGETRSNMAFTLLSKRGGRQQVGRSLRDLNHD